MRNHRHSRDWSVSVVDRSFTLPLCRWCLTWESCWYLCNSDILISLTYLFSPSMSTLPIKIILARKSDLVSSPSSYSIVPPVLSTSMLLTFTLRYHENMWAAAVDTNEEEKADGTPSIAHVVHLYTIRRIRSHGQMAFSVLIDLWSTWDYYWLSLGVR